ncbi:coenzyme PQQ biosynthesis probable peptidase PqqF [Pseudomonas linyingensis]|uniref:Coenzyme PQQ biosynthesis probable peptidase PqqF n=1 Tax=Pseudomonas linyingensis TaxID=915471 RepID=A0A1H6TYG6_9PSED|nr:insulinase family protein [Pseudomonas linyingensis]SEI84246.1 coenzyme PQQ biosynthesis probable peptidase PqqF [Pseudomonas linyingensis]
MDSDFPQLAHRSLRLGNGVSAAVLHDPQATRVALAISVAAGSFHEPPQWPGLAHFLEHSLFLGSRGFPEVDAFAAYVHGHGGRYNARTLGLQTLYYLEMPARELRPALLRLVDLLARPLLADARLQAEREVLEAEYRARCADGDCQLQGAIAGQLHPQHPLARFHAGSRDTLDTSDPRLLADLRAWQRRHYGGANLRLLVSGPQSLDELEHVTRELAGALPAGARTAEESWPSLWPVGQGAVELALEQPQVLQHMSLWLPLRVAPAREDELLALLRQAVAQPADGGLLAELRARGWAQQLSVDCHPGGAGEALLVLRIELQEHGCGAERAIAALCCDWLRALAGDPALALPPDEWPALSREQAWQELELAPMERAGLWVERWQRQGGIEWQPWASEAAAPRQRLRELAQVSPQRLILQIARERLDDGALTPRFPVRATVTPLPGLPAVALPAWQVPPRNPFVDAGGAGAGAAWPAGWTQDDTLTLRPGHAALLLAWQLPGASDAATRLVAELAEAALASQWQQALAGAARLGHDWQPLSRPGQLRGCLSGPAQVLPRVLTHLLATLRDGEPAAWRAALQRRRAATAQQLLLRQLLAHPAAGWRVPLDAAADEVRLDELSDAELRERLQAFFATALLHGRRFGALPAAAAAALSGLGQPVVGAPLSAAAPWRGGEHEQRLPVMDEPGGAEQAVLLRLLAPPGQPVLEAAWRVLAILQQGAFYQSLRVEQGLGYALFSRFHAGEDGAELQFGVQSPHANGQRLQQALRTFIEQQGSALAGLSAQRLQQAREAALEALDGGSRRARLLNACSDWLGGRAAGQHAAVREALLQLDVECLQRAAVELGGAEWRWLLSP